MLTSRTVLDWHSAKDSHRSHLSAFRCTLPEHGYFDEDEGFVCHDYPWELEVQNHIQSCRPVTPPHFLLVGYDDVGLAAVIVLQVAPLDRHCFIEAVAVAQRVSGNGLVQEAIARASHVMSKYGFASDFLVTARIDPRNVSAQSAFTKAGFEHIESRSGFELWARRY